MRLIDADYAKDALHYIPWIDPEQTDDCIDKCPTVELPRWIPVEERLPEPRNPGGTSSLRTLMVLFSLHYYLISVFGAMMTTASITALPTGCRYRRCRIGN